MTLALGTRIGPYEITGRLGAGGMGEVYRARDARLNRDVAIKVLPEAFALDGERLARFRREAQVLASLNHPHIAAIYGLEDPGPTDAAPDVRALVLELVEGQTLAELLAKSSPLESQGMSHPEPSAMSQRRPRGLAIDEALAIARQICDALDAAHDQGIVHRDLKPANIKVRPDGSVKVLDFGLAKVTEAVTSASPLSMSPTVTSPAAVSVGGVILGTAAYMSPEQARGKLVDKRSDIWAFGCVLYEMLTGRPAFEGEDVADTLSRVLQREPDFTALPPETPQAVRRLLASCFQKDRHKRLPQIAVAAFQIDEALSGLAESSRVAEAPASERSPRRLIPAVIAACVASALVGAAAVWLSAPRATSAPPPVTRLVLGVAPADEIGGNEGRPSRTALALSPDGRTLVFSALRANQRALYIRRFEEADATLIPGTEGGDSPFFSPDGGWIGFWAGGEIRKVPMTGGPPVRLSDAAQVLGASWDQADRIVFAGISGGLWEVPAAGGTPLTLTTVNRERGEVSHRLPHALPGGDGVAYTVTKNRFPRWDQTDIAVYSRRTGMSTVVLEGGADARYVSTGHLVFVREGVLLAAPFDLERLDVTGGQVGVAADVMQAAYPQGQPVDSGAGQFTISTTGTLVYVPGGTFPPAERSVISIDRAGRSEVLPIMPRPFVTLRRSPDGQQIALSTFGRDRDVWVYALARGTLTRLPLPGRNSVPIWTPDGARITFAAAGTSGLDGLHSVRADGGGSPETLVSGEQHLVAGTWTPDAQELIYYGTPTELGSNVPLTWVQNIVSKGMPSPFTGLAANGGGVDVSPDGRWIAYQAGGPNQSQVHVQAYPGPGPRYQVSTDGGFSPIWRADGRELFYARRDGLQTGLRGLDVSMMAVSVATQPTFTFGTPTQLFVGPYEMNAPARAYDVTADGQRFFLLQARERPPTVITQMVVVENWHEELTRLAPTR